MLSRVRHAAARPRAREAGRRGAGRAQQGFALLEALVSLLIFATAFVGLVGLQAAMTRAQGSAKSRADAIHLGSQLVGSIWADRAHLAQYDSAGGCDGYPPCMDWKARVAATLPGGSGRIAAAQGTGELSITVTWSIPGEGTHSHVLATSIR